MLSAEAKARRKAERQALREYWAGDQSEPFVVESCDDYCVCDVFVTSLFSNMTMSLRYIVLSLARVTPVSPIKVFLYRLLGVKIGRGVYIGPGVLIDPLFPWLIELEDNCLLGIGCRLLTHEYTATNFRIARVRIGKGAVVGAFSTVRSGVTVGRKVTIGFNSYVNKDVPDGATVGGVPAVPLKPGGEVDR